MKAKEIDKIINEAKKTAEMIFIHYPAEVEDEISKGHEEKRYLRDELDKAIKTYNTHSVFYDVRNEQSLRSRINMVLSGNEKLPYNKETTQLSGTNEEKLIFLLWNQFVRLKKMEHLKGKLYQQKKDIYSNIFEAFTDSEKHQRIMNLLVTKKYCQSGSYFWIGNKSELIDLLKELNNKGYLLRKLTQAEMVLISKNSFGNNISKSTLRTKPTDSKKSVFNFIPLASTIS